MTQSRAWKLWAAVILACPIAIYALGMAFHARWLAPDRSGWSSHVVGFLFLAHVILCLGAIITPPRSARGGTCLVAIGVVLLDCWLTLTVAMAAMMASHYE